MEALGGIAFGQGLPADFLLASMQVLVAPALGIPLAGRDRNGHAGGAAEPAKAEAHSLHAVAGNRGKEGEIFRTCLSW